MIIAILLTIFAYLLGSLPFGYWITKRVTGKNIQNHGSGNIGSTNVRRIAGKKASILTQVLDMLKGLLPVLIAFNVHRYGFVIPPDSILFVALAAILGHNFSLFLELKGGKGVNTSLGASVLICPIPVFIAVSIYLIVRYVFKFVSLGSLFIALSLPISFYFLYGYNHILIYLIVVGILIIVQHQSNIIRLLKGEELGA